GDFPVDVLESDCPFAAAVLAGEALKGGLHGILIEDNRIRLDAAEILERTFQKGVVEGGEDDVGTLAALRHVGAGLDRIGVADVETALADARPRTHLGVAQSLGGIRAAAQGIEAAIWLLRRHVVRRATPAEDDTLEGLFVLALLAIHGVELAEPF